MYSGVYRLYQGAEIKESLFDENTGTIGIYTVPLDFSTMGLDKSGGGMLRYKLYGHLNASGSMLACVAVSSDVYMNIYPNVTEFQGVDGKWNQSYPHADIREHSYIPIGYTQTVQKCMAIYQYPYYLLQDYATKDIVDFPGLRLDDINYTFPMQIFRELADSTADAIYLDKAGKTHLIRKGE